MTTKANGSQTKEKTTRPLQELVPDDANPRAHDARNLDAIRNSLSAFGQVEPLVVQASSRRVIGGNGRLEAMESLGWTEAWVEEIDVDDVTARALSLALNRTGELAQWDATHLLRALEDTMGSYELDALGFAEDELAELLDAAVPEVAGEGDDGTYTRKIEAPIYEPKGDRPALSELFDRSKTDELVRDIDAAELPEDVAAFLRLAAERHTVFLFDRIAEFYAHANPETQELFERSALVIIDFEKAIENGFVKMTERLGALVEREGFSR